MEQSEKACVPIEAMPSGMLTEVNAHPVKAFSLMEVTVLGKEYEVFVKGQTMTSVFALS